MIKWIKSLFKRKKIVIPQEWLEMAQVEYKVEPNYSYELEVRVIHKNDSIFKNGFLIGTVKNLNQAEKLIFEDLEDKINRSKFMNETPKMTYKS